MPSHPASHLRGCFIGATILSSIPARSHSFRYLVRPAVRSRVLSRLAKTISLLLAALGVPRIRCALYRVYVLAQEVIGVRILSKPLPYFCWYAADADTDENFRAMTDEQVGFYLRCLNHCWINGSLPADPDEAALVMGRSRSKFDRLWERVGKCFRAHPENPLRVINPRQEKERASALNKSEKARASADARWMRTHSEGNARASDSVYESSGDLKEKKDGEILRADFDDQWQDFIRLYTETGKALIPEDFTKAHFIWRVLDFSQRTEALAKLAERKLLHDPQFIPKPERFLQGGEYARAVVARSNGNGLSRHDQIRKAMEEA